VKRRRVTLADDLKIRADLGLFGRKLDRKGLVAKFFGVPGGEAWRPHILNERPVPDGPVRAAGLDLASVSPH